MKRYLYHLKRWVLPATFGSVIFLSIAHHTFNYWELPASKLIALFFVVVPICTAGMFLFGKKLLPQISQIPKTEIGLFLVGALIIGSFITWRNFRVPSSYQTLTITPELSQGQTIRLLEVKAAGNVISIQQVALKNHWQEVDGFLYATSDSAPIDFSFRSTANSPLSLLFEKTEPSNGHIDISIGYDTVRLDVGKADSSMSLIQIASRYRGIPNWIFIPALVIIDAITFGVLIFLALLLQKLGQISISDEKTVVSTPDFDLLLLIVLGFVLHLVSILTIPLILDRDSPIFLQGAVHLLKFGNWNGVSEAAGPGTTLLFAPVMFLFGRNPWGMKILLHLLALGCIPICYRLGWQISRNRQVSFLSGLLVVISPDAYLYASYVMSDLPNFFVILLFCTLLISALETMSLKWIFANLITGSFATLLRSENILLLGIGVLALASTSTWGWFQDRSQDLKKTFINISLALLLAFLPIQWWSVRNQKVHGFYGTANYLGGVMYDGWVYFGDASKISFSDRDSTAIQQIEAVAEQYPIEITDKNGFATARETIQSLMEAGYTFGEATDLLKTAALDSIQKDPSKSIELLFLKYETGIQPEIAYNITYPLPDEPAGRSEISIEFFEADKLRVASLIKLQRTINQLGHLWYPHLYPYWVLLCILGLVLGLFRRPAITWVTLVTIVASRIFIPLSLSVPFWRYTLAGWFPLQIIAIGWIWVTYKGAISLFVPRKTS